MRSTTEPIPSASRIAARAVREGAISYDDVTTSAYWSRMSASCTAADRSAASAARAARRASRKCQRAALNASSACATRISESPSRCWASSRRPCMAATWPALESAASRAARTSARLGCPSGSPAIATQPGPAARPVARVRATATVAARVRTSAYSLHPLGVVGSASGDFPIARGTSRHASAISSHREHFPQFSHRSPACRLDELHVCHSPEPSHVTRCLVAFPSVRTLGKPHEHRVTCALGSVAQPGEGG